MRNCYNCQVIFEPTHDRHIFCTNGCACRWFGQSVSDDEAINTLTLGRLGQEMREELTIRTNK